MPPQNSLSAWALVKYDPDAVIPDLLDSLRSDSPWVRWRAALALGLYGDPRGVEPLIRALGDPDLEVRRRVIASLGEIGEREAVEPLKRMLIDDIGDDWILIKQTMAKIQSRRLSGNARGREADYYTETGNGTNGNQTLPH
jgi:HEAT repeat protein